MPGADCRTGISLSCGCYFVYVCLSLRVSVSLCLLISESVCFKVRACICVQVSESMRVIVGVVKCMCEYAKYLNLNVAFAASFVGVETEYVNACSGMQMCSIYAYACSRCVGTEMKTHVHGCTVHDCVCVTSAYIQYMIESAHSLQALYSFVFWTIDKYVITYLYGLVDIYELYIFFK